MATLTVEERSGGPAVPGQPASRFRGDIDGLRALAILLVVGYHVGLPLFGGGFVGVDVFFVISGFLISRNLLRESETDDRVALGSFWARRVRRLVPALALVLAVTLLVGYVVMPGFDLDDLARQSGAAALYASNLLFAGQAQNYFAADISTSPVLHTWSLGVEEQFYLVWPLIFAGACWLWVRRRRPSRSRDRRTTLIVVFVAVLAASLALNVVLTDHGSTWAFFGLPSRAWEFAVAGLLAAVPVPSAMRRAGARTGAAIVGLALIGAAVLLLDSTTPYPGLWAVLPVSGAALMIVAGETWQGALPAAPLSAALSVRPLQWLGRVSYSWYLWHWPAIVLLGVALDRHGRTPKAVAALVSLPVAWAAYRYYETPLRFARPIARSVPRTFAFGAAITAVVLLLAFAVKANAPGISTASPLAALTLADLEAPPGSSLQDRVNVAVARYRQRSDNSCPKHATKTGDGDDYCVGGDLSATTTVMLLGDSHAGQWRNALEQLASRRHIRLVTRQHNGCPAYPVRTTDGKGGTKTAVCVPAHEGDIRVLDALKPDAVIIATWSGERDRILDADGHTPDEASQLRIWGDAVESLVSTVRDKGIPLGIILDEPTLPLDASTCVAAKNSIEACEVDRAHALAKSGASLEIERRVAADHGVPVLDMTDIVCDQSTCHLELDGALVYVDTHHLTDGYALRLTPQLESLMGRLTG